MSLFLKEIAFDHTKVVTIHATQYAFEMDLVNAYLRSIKKRQRIKESGGLTQKARC